MMTARQTLDLALQQLSAYLGNEKSARQEARWLLCHVLGIKLPSLLANLEQVISERDSETYFSCIEDRVQKHKPLAYILGSAPFCGLEIKVREPFLIPRHETEELVWSLITKFQDQRQEHLKILDLCTGTGAIALAFAAHLPSAQVVATDIDRQVLQLARENQEAAGVSNVTFLHANLFKGLEGQTFDLIISNPPYLSEKEWARITPDVKNWETREALVGGRTGLEIYTHIIAQAGKHLTSRLASSQNPQLVLEHGSTQAKEIDALLEAAGFTKRAVWIDSFQHERAALAKI